MPCIRKGGALRRRPAAAAAGFASTNEEFRAITEDNTFFPVIFMSQDELEDAVRRIRSATEDVMGG